MPRPLTAALLLAAFPLAAAAQQPKGKEPPKLPEGTRAERDVEYGPHERNKLDLYVPKADGPVPLIIWVHGGAWEKGDKTGPNPALPFLARGYAVAAVNYRLSHHDVFPAQIHDVRAAVRYLRANAGKYNLDPDRLGAWGASAGGYLVALLGTAGDVPELEGNVGGNAGVSSRVQAVVDWFGPTDLRRLSQSDAPANPVTRLLGGDTGKKKDVATAADPITHVSKKDPPVLIVHGDADRDVPLSQSELFRDALKAGGVPVELLVLPRAGHANPEFITQMTNANNRTKTADFFDKYLKGK